MGKRETLPTYRRFAFTTTLERIKMIEGKQMPIDVKQPGFENGALFEV